MPHMRRILDSLTSRKVSLGLMAFVVLGALTGVVVPQRSLTAPASIEEWRAANPAGAAVADTLALDHVFSSWWFLIGLSLFGISLGVATLRMAEAARRRAFGPFSARMSVPQLDAQGVTARALSRGYRIARTPDGQTRLVRHAIGWWGPTVLHVGLTAALALGVASLALSARGVADLSTSEIRMPGDAYVFSEPDVFGRVAEPGVAMRLDSVVPETWSGGELRSWEATVSFNDAGEWVSLGATPNDPLEYAGHTIYFSPGEFGPAAFVELSGDGLPDRPIRLEFPLGGADEPVYTTFDPEGWPTVEARWDPGLTRADRPLAIRVQEETDTPLVTLDVGDSGEFGRYKATFVAAADWARLIIVRPIAILPLFLSFAVIAAGSLMIYLWVPRELVVEAAPDGVRYAWRAARMPHLYLSERDEIIGTPAEETP